MTKIGLIVFVALAAFGCALENPSASPGAFLTGGIVLPDGDVSAADGSVEAGRDVPLDQLSPSDVADVMDASDGVSVDQLDAAVDVMALDMVDVSTMDQPSDVMIPIDQPVDVGHDVGTDAGPLDTGPICPSGQTLCGTTCVVTSNDVSNCGRCGNVCPSSPANGSSSCGLGACGLVCDTNFGNCDAVFANGCEAALQADSRNCGTCGNACATGSFCSAGVCRSSCTLTVCGTACVDTQTSPMNCGGCDRACVAREHQSVSCAGGSCRSLCDTGFDNCDGVTTNGCETVLATDPANCSACGNICPARPNAVRSCVAGICGLTCNGGFGNCDTNPTNGCETVLTTDLANCGGCGNACPARANATSTCGAGACGFTCNPGFGDCDGVAANGCEVALATSLMNCGACGNVCQSRVNATGTCVASTCGLVCSAGFGNCDSVTTNGCELDTRADRNNCGGCGIVCPSGVCAASVCLPPIPPGVELGLVTSRGVYGVRVNTASVQSGDAGPAIRGPCLPSSPANTCRTDLRQLPSPNGATITVWHPDWGFEVEPLDAAGNSFCPVGDPTCRGCWDGTTFSCITVTCTDPGAIPPRPMVFNQGYHLPLGHNRLRLGLNTTGQRGFCSVP